MPGVLKSMGLQRVRHNLATEQQKQDKENQDSKCSEKRQSGAREAMEKRGSQPTVENQKNLLQMSSGAHFSYGRGDSKGRPKTKYGSILTCLESGQNQVGSIKGKKRKRQDQKVCWGQKIEDYREIHLIKELRAWE